MTMAAARASLGRIFPESSILFLCDMQEKLRDRVLYFPQIVSMAARMLKNTALDLLDRGLQVHVAVDACSSQSEMNRLVALARMQHSGVFLSTSEALTLQLIKDAAHPQFKEIQKILKEPVPEIGLLGFFQGMNNPLLPNSRP
ncbi:isochorismatase domain-containing protein 2 isoform X4 [Rattus norvegicus]